MARKRIQVKKIREILKLSYEGNLSIRQIAKVCGASYHLYARINRQEYLLKSVFIKTMFIIILKRAKRKYSFQIGNYCIMDNHIHFILKPLKGEVYHPNSGSICNMLN